MTTAYDEELTPEFDPPVIEPPPAATLLGRIFAHRRGRPTVVRAPLVRVDEPQSPDISGETAETGNAITAETSHPEPPAQPTPPAPPEPDRAVEAEPEPEIWRASTPAVATRFCPLCGERVPMAADGLHCHLGHRLSGAHRESKRRWFRRRAR